MDIVIGGIYRHFKGNIYKVLYVAKDSETLMDLVIYQDTSDTSKIWVRKKDMFLSKVDKNKYPNANQEYRFELIDEAYK